MLYMGRHRFTSLRNREAQNKDSPHYYSEEFEDCSIFLLHRPTGRRQKRTLFQTINSQKGSEEYQNQQENYPTAYVDRIYIASLQINSEMIRNPEKCKEQEYEAMGCYKEFGKVTAEATQKRKNAFEYCRNFHSTIDFFA